MQPSIDAVDRELSSVGAAAGKRLRELTQEIWRLLIEDIPELRGDDVLAQLLDASIEENVMTLLHAFEHGIPPDRVDPPAAAVEYARRLAQRGVPIVALIRSYRMGHGRFLTQCMQELTGRYEDTELVNAIMARMIGLSFQYIDRVSEHVIAVYQQERDGWLLTRTAVRSARVQAVLRDERVDLGATEAALGYNLRQHHLAVLAWVVEDGEPGAGLARLDRLTAAAAGTLGCAGRPLFVPQDETLAWIWLPLGARVSPDLLAEAFDDGDIRVAVGEPAHGLEGFRGTLRQALRTRDVALAADPGTRVTTFAEVGPLALMCADIPATREWVHDTLGELAVDDEPRARLRETLRIFLATGASYTATAERMTLHKNSVQYRIRKAEEALRTPIQDRRAEVELALRACRHLGRTVLRGN
jgi:DNA-binding PucR family transcriptional regulator